ncbi:hypothetical protein R1sor_007138 [Riccia sorocarpa]|uniref:Uncharacterized protein n=1 Tax=Riccia sorocarpa TaxID=122646 RepID=A0ABD3HSG8_9MARC
MDNIRYYLEEPHPEDLPLTRVVCVGDEVEYYKDMTKYTGSRKQKVATMWSWERKDFFVIRPEFVTVQKLWKGAVTSNGALKFVEESGAYVRRPKLKKGEKLKKIEGMESVTADMWKCKRDARLGEEEENDRSDD